MSNKIVLLVDIHNWYTGCQKKYPGYRVNYSGISQLLPFRYKIAFGRQAEDKVQSFAKLLRNLNFEVRFGQSPYNIEMALEVAQMIERRAVDHLVIGSSYFETLGIHEYAFHRGIETTTIGFGVPEAFHRVGNVIELDLDGDVLKKDDEDEVPRNSTVACLAA